jgi:hypothetical protein
MKKLLLGLLALIDALIGLQVLVAIDAVKSEDALWLSGAIIGAWIGIVWFWISLWYLYWRSWGELRVGQAVIKVGQQRLERKQRDEQPPPPRTLNPLPAKEHSNGRTK